MFLRNQFTDRCCFDPREPSGSGIDDDILSQVEGLDDDAGDGNEGQDGQQQPHDELTDGGSPPPRNQAERVASDKGKQAPRLDGNGKPIQPAKSAPRGPQDLLDPQTGQVIAKGGNERRHYENFQKEKLRADNASRDLTAAQARLSAFETSGGVGTQLGLSPEQVTTGARLVKSWMDDPVATIKNLLTLAQSQGLNIEGIGQGTDVNAIKNMIAEHMKPFTDARQQNEQQTAARSEAQRTWESFTSTHADAPMHVDAIAHLLGEDKNLSLDGAYYKLQAFYREHQLDWNVPLQEHMRLAKEAKANGAAGQRTQNVPTGRRVQSNVQNNETSMSATSSIDDIIRESMAEAGYRN
jgi:hypothetical protein